MKLIHYKALFFYNFTASTYEQNIFNVSNILGRLNQSYCATDKVTSLHNTHFVLVILYTMV